MSSNDIYQRFAEADSSPIICTIEKFELPSELFEIKIPAAINKVRAYSRGINTYGKQLAEIIHKFDLWWILDFLPSSTILHYIKNGRRNPNYCPVCGILLTNYRSITCSYRCKRIKQSIDNPKTEKPKRHRKRKPKYNPSIDGFRPTFLYIKRHAKTGMQYFGKTSQNPEEYFGSGKYWKNHIRKYGIEYVETLWFCLFTNADDIMSFAINFSNEHDIVKSALWANLEIENGLDGGSNGWNHLHGKTAVFDRDGNKLIVDKGFDRTRYTSVTAGRIAVKDSTGKCFNVDKNDPRYLSGELVGIASGKVIVKDVNGSIFQIDKNDPRYLSGELSGVTKGISKITVYDTESNEVTRIETEIFHQQKPRYVTIYRAKKIGLIGAEG